MPSKSRIARLVVVILLVGLAFQILFDPLSTVIHLGESLQARMGLPLARRRWEAQEIAHYRFDIKGYIPLVCIFGGNVEVEDGRVIRTGPSSDAGTDLNPFLDPGILASDNLPAICNYENYTMPRLFDEIERFPPFDITGISFDPDYGFVSSFRFGNCSGRGLLSPSISDCSGGFSISNFQVLEK